MYLGKYEIDGENVHPEPNSDIPRRLSLQPIGYKGKGRHIFGGVATAKANSWSSRQEDVLKPNLPTKKAFLKSNLRTEKYLLALQCQLALLMYCKFTYRLNVWRGATRPIDSSTTYLVICGHRVSWKIYRATHSKE